MVVSHESITLRVRDLIVFASVLHFHYVWFLCCLSLNCAFDVNQILLQHQDGPPLIEVPSAVTQPVPVKL